MKLEQEFIDHLLTAEDSQMDACLFDDIIAWENNPSALDILNILDKIVYSSLASGFVVEMFRILLDAAIEEEGTTYEEVIKYRKERD